MKYKFTLAILCCMPVHAIYAQVRSLNSDVKVAWVTVPAGVSPDGSNNVTIQSGHTIRLDSTASCKNLSIQKGATLNSVTDANTKLLTLTVGGADSVTVRNEGTFGSDDGPGDGIALMIGPKSKNLSIIGDGATAIGSLTQSGNSQLMLMINSNMNLKGRDLVFSANNQANNSAQNNVTFVLAKNKTIRLTNAAGLIHGYSSSGNYSYVINGTLDMAATTATQSIKAGDQSAVTFAVNGKMKLGNGLSASGGHIAFNIADGALVDASKTNTMKLGNAFFATEGKGALLRYVDNSAKVFPVGISGAANANGLSLTNHGTPGYFKVSVKNSVEGNLDNNSKMLNREWTVVPDSGATAYQLIVAPSWTVGDQLAVADPASMAVAQLQGSSWKNFSGILSGQGNSGTPFTVSAAGEPNSAGVYTVARTATSFILYPNPATNLVTVQHIKAVAGAHIKIMGLYGKTMYDGIVTEGDKNTTLDLSTLAKGTYVVRFENADKSYTSKLIKNQ